MLAITRPDVIMYLYLNGSLIHSRRSKLIAVKFIIDAVPSKMSAVVHILEERWPIVQPGPVSRYTVHIGMENSATHKSVHARDTRKEFVTVRM